MRETTVTFRLGNALAQDLAIGPHRLIADEPAEFGGEDAGPMPGELLQASLGACMAITLRMYARRKGWPLENVEVSLNGEKAEAGYHIAIALRLDGPLSDEQRARLLQIAEHCPIHRILEGPITIATTAIEA